MAREARVFAEGTLKWVQASGTGAAWGTASAPGSATVGFVQAGTTTTFVVLNLQTTLATIETNRARAKADHRRAITLYEQEIGVTLTRHNIDLAH